MRFNRRLLPVYVFAVLVVATPDTRVTAQTTQAVPVSEVGVASIRIDNFGQVNANYYRGAQPAGRDYDDLAALGVKTIIDLQADGDNYDEQQLVEAAGMRFYRIGMTGRVAPTPEQLAQFMAIVTDPEQGAVYVHCKGGRHRTGVMTAVYRMEKDGWTAKQAFREMKEYEFGFDFLHPEFKRFVFGYKPQLATTQEVTANATR